MTGNNSTPNRNEKLSCTECGQPFAKGYMNAHMRKAHNIFRRGPKAQKKPTTTSKEIVKSKIITLPQPEFQRMQNLVVLRDSHNNIWIAERMQHEQ